MRIFFLFYDISCIFAIFFLHPTQSKQKRNNNNKFLYIFSIITQIHQESSYIFAFFFALRLDY